MRMIVFIYVQSRMLTTITKTNPKPNANIIISLKDMRTLCIQGRLNEALHILHITDIPVDLCSDDYVRLLQGCIQKKALADGKRVHAHINQSGFVFTTDKLLHNTLVSMYVKCGSLVDASRVFNQIPERDVCSWTVMIAAYARHGFYQEALGLFHQMQWAGIQPNEFTLASVLPACAGLGSPELGVQIHEEIIRRGFLSDVAVGNALVDMYAKCGGIENARELFDKMPERDVVSWTLMIASYARQGLAKEALGLFHQMQGLGIQPNHFTFATVLSACAELGFLEEGMEIHEEIIRGGYQPDVFVMSGLVDLYAKCGSVDKARNIFYKMHRPDLVSWNAMVAGYAQNGFVDEALELFQVMPQRDAFSWMAMLAGYVQNGLIEDALKLFQEIPERDVFSWTVMIAGFAQNGHGWETLMLFRRMQLAGIMPDAKTFASVLPACTELAALEQGMEIHEKIITGGFQSDAFVVNALMDMYAKCGSIPEALRLFDNMHHRDLASWNAMISGYAMYGCGKESLKLFEQMKLSGMCPDQITLLSVLSACSHAGLVDEGYQCFICINDYHITPIMEHYSCMVDLLGRAGRLDEALDFINKMPIKPNASVWSCLLAACRIHNNIELAECAANHIFELDSESAVPYVLLSNIYATVGRWSDITKVRQMMNDRGIKKTAGCSWIEVNKQVHAFLGGDDRYHIIAENLDKDGEVGIEGCMICFEDRYCAESYGGE